MLSNLSCGVLVFGANGLVKTSNPAGKVDSRICLRQRDERQKIFFAARCLKSDGPTLGERSQRPRLRRRRSSRRAARRQQATPGSSRISKLRRAKSAFLSITVSQVPAVDGSLLGVACLINDLSEFEKIRRQQDLHGELSAEMALQLRVSLATIAGYAQQLANNRDPELAKQIAIDIAQEAAQLERNLGGFLMAKPAAQKSAAAAAGSMKSARNGTGPSQPGRKTDSGEGDTMKRFAHTGIGLTLILVAAGLPAAAQNQAPSASPRARRISSLGTYARQVRKDPRRRFEAEGVRQRQFAQG